MKFIRVLVMLLAAVVVTGCETDESYDRDPDAYDNSALYVGLSVENQRSGVVEVYVGNTSYPKVLYPDNPEDYSRESSENWSFHLYDDQEQFVRIVVYDPYGYVVEDRTFIITNEYRNWSFVIDDYQGIRMYHS